jgi:hypothetical protein
VFRAGRPDLSVQIEVSRSIRDSEAAVGTPRLVPAHSDRSLHTPSQRRSAAPARSAARAASGQVIMGVERWVYLKDGVLMLHTENDGATYLRRGREAVDVPVVNRRSIRGSILQAE